MAKMTVKRCILCCVTCFLFFQITSSNTIPTTANGQSRSYYQKYREDEYYTIDGSYNNMMKPDQGKVGTPFKRYMKNAYEDGVSIPPTNRPDPRKLSRCLFQGNTNFSLETETKVNAWSVMFGQFLVHDLGLVKKGDSIQCCPTPLNSPECMAIKPEADDEIRTKTDCLNFIRSDFEFSEEGTREQLNGITHYMDGSNIYGSTKEELSNLVNYATGKLKETHVGHNPLPPTKSTFVRGNKCPLFIAGDTRSNENTVLTAQHVIWMREHNLIVDKLRRINSNWNSNKLFEEARRIVIAELQYIIYNEFLPLIIGYQLMCDFSLNSSGGYEYDPKTDASISNVFITAAFRYGHGMVDDNVFLEQNSTGHQRRDTRHVCRNDVYLHSCKNTHIISLEESMKGQDGLYECENSIDAIVQGMVRRHSQKGNDMRAAKTLTLKSLDIVDLFSFNIQRGRDHGLPSYNEWRKWLGLKPLSFSDPPTTHSKDVVDKLKEMYKTEKYIDLFVGGILENKEPDAVLGPTFARLIAKQFNDIKRGDRFWYENRIFYNDQLKVIENQTMSKVIFRNTGVKHLPVNSFLVPDSNNMMIDGKGSDFDISPWSAQTTTPAISNTWV